MADIIRAGTKHRDPGVVVEHQRCGSLVRFYRRDRVESIITGGPWAYVCPVCDYWLDADSVDGPVITGPAPLCSVCGHPPGSAYCQAQHP